MSMIFCESCQRHRDTDFMDAEYDEITGDWKCEACMDLDEEKLQADEAYWRELYEGEKLAGFLPANHYPGGR